MRLVDSHCHLDDRQFDADREAVIERALAAGVELMLAIGSGDGPPDLEAAIRLAEAHAPVYATVGVHPHDASKATPETYRRLEEMLAHPKVTAVGEIGLDYHYDFSPREVQREVFIRQLRLAREAAKPVIIHTREAWEDTLRLLGEHAPRAGIMHCFSGGPEEARECLELGLHLSFAGVVTFPKALRVQAAARATPLERLLAETDAPYLAPVPVRGKRNEPAFVVHTARKLAELRGETFEQVAAATTANFRRLCRPVVD
ncbi:MAG: TatD family hydrolase [Acidobacteriota bacterium]